MKAIHNKDYSVVKTLKTGFFVADAKSRHENLF